MGSLLKSRFGSIAREIVVCLSPLLFAAALFATILLITFVPMVADRACVYAGLLAQPLGQSLDGLACAEFFLNRYQTLIGVGAAFAVGIIAVRPVWRQVRLSSEQILIAGQSFVVDAIEYNANDRLRLNRIAQLLSHFETLGWFIDVFGESPEPALADSIRKQYDRIRSTARSAMEEWSEFEDHPRLGEQERKNRIVLLALLQKIMAAFHHPLTELNKSNEENDLKEFELILRLHGEISEKELPNLKEVCRLSSAWVSEEHRLHSKHAAAVRKSILAHTE
jgi:hypothetical protein